MPESFARTIAGRADHAWLTQVEQVLTEAWRETPQLGEADRMMFELAVHEIAANMVEHAGYARCDLELSVDPRQLSVRMQDDGPPVAVNPATATMPDLQAETGRGLAIALQVLDVFEHHRTGGTNHWLLVRSIG